MHNALNTQRKFDKSCIYKISCRNCDKVHVGQMKRNLSIRYIEHSLHTRNGEMEKSAVTNTILSLEIKV